MSRSRHEAVSALFAQARRVAPGDRAGFLDEACRDDPQLRREVESLLAAHDDPSGLSDLTGARHRIGAVAAALTEGAAAPPPERIGPYRIIGVLGEGGMGIVYEAEQDDPRRRVALKVIRPAMVSRRLLRRFRHEAQVLGRLRHPGIAQIYHAGTADSGRGGQPFFAMELVTGLTLPEYAARNELGTRQRLELVARICDALHHAHRQGVIHRDLKPANIVVEDGRPRILDFGVARATDADVQTVTLQTDVGQLVGTVPYMSPEQASGDPSQVDIRSDLYALGVITFELLTGRLPYPVGGKMIHEAVRIIREDEPSRLSAIDRNLRGDVETIVAKALAKEKDRRYASAAELAADIRRYLHDEPIVARPTSVAYQVRKFARRNKALVAGVAVAFTALVGATAFSLREAAVAQGQREVAEARAADARRQAARATVAAAATAAGARDPATARRLLDAVPADLRGWEWRYYDAQLDKCIARIDVDHAPVAAAADDGGSMVRALSPDGVLRSWDAFTSKLLAAHDLGPDDVRSAAFTRDGRRLAVLGGSGDGEDRAVVTVWDLTGAAGVDRVAARGLPAAGSVVVVSGHGRRVAVKQADHAWIWDVASDAVSRWPVPESARQIAISDDGARVALACAGQGQFRLQVHDADDGSRISYTYHLRDPVGVALSPDGSMTASGGLDKRIRVRAADDAALIRTFAGHTDVPGAFGFSASGGRIVSGGADATIRVWGISSGDCLEVFSGHRGAVRSVGFSADDIVFLSTADDDTIRLWQRGVAQRTAVLDGHTSYVYGVAFSADGERLLTGGWDGAVHVWDAAGAERIEVVPSSGRAVYCLAVSPDGHVLALGLESGVQLRDASSLRLLRELAVPEGPVNAVGFGPSGGAVAALAASGTVYLWDADTEAPPLKLPGSGQREAGLAFSPDGRRLATTHPDAVRIRDAREGGDVAVLAVPAAAHAVAWSPDGKRLAGGLADGTVLLWDTDRVERRRVLTGHASEVFSLAFSPDGTRLASGSNDTSIRLWDPVNGEPVAQLRGHDDYVFALAFSPDGVRLASGSGDGSVRLWDTAPLRARWQARVAAQRLRETVRPLVRRLYETEDALSVVDAIKADPSLAGERRRAALQVAHEIRVPDSGVACDPFDGFALEFDGTDDHLRIDPADALRMTDAFTLEAWIRPALADAPRRHRAVINKEGEYQIALGTDGTLLWTVAVGRRWLPWISTGYRPPDGSWTHVALVYGRAGAAFVVNGRKIHARRHAGRIGDRHPAVDELRFGGRQHGADENFAGWMDEVRLWNVARSPEEIAGAMRSPLSGSEPGLVGYWRFDDAGDGIARDATGRHDAVIAGALRRATRRCGERE